MALVTLLTGTKGSPYVAFWGYIAYLAYRGRADDIYLWTKWVVVISGGVFLFLLFFGSQSFYRLLGAGSREEFLIAGSFPLLIKCAIFTYLYNTRESTTGAKIRLTDSISAVSERKEGREAPISKPTESLKTSSNRNLVITNAVKHSPEKAIEKLSPDVEESFYELIAEELRNDTVRAGLWTKAIASSEGDEAKIKVNYIKLRFEQLANDWMNKAREDVKQREFAERAAERTRCVYCSAEISEHVAICPHCNRILPR